VLDDFFVAGAETASSAEGTGEGADNHVDFSGVDVLGFGDAAAGAAKDAVGPGFVEDEAEFVLEFEFDLGIVSRGSARS
jgi:hypothetical protein